jgi:hypothetical protein
MTENEELLINIYNDLRDKLDAGNKYNLIKASGLVRQLLMDGAPLVDQVNRDYKLKIVFRTQKNRPKFGDFVDASGQKWETVIGVTLINPTHNDEEYISYVKRDAFLNYPVINFAGLDFSVQEIIKICAHVYGGIHSGKIEDKRDYYLDWANKTLSYSDGLDCTVKSIGEITSIVIDAIKPLVDAIQAKNNAA